MVVLYVLGSIVLIADHPLAGAIRAIPDPVDPVSHALAGHLCGALATRAARSGGRWRWASRAVIATIVFILIQQLFTLYKTFTKHHEPATIADASGQTPRLPAFLLRPTWQPTIISGLARPTREARPVVATSTPHLTYLETGLPSIMPPYEHDPSRAEQLLEGVPVTYLVVDNLDFLDVGRRYGTPVVRTFPSRWKLVYVAEDWGPRIYQWSPAAGVK